MPQAQESLWPKAEDKREAGVWGSVSEPLQLDWCAEKGRGDEAEEAVGLVGRAHAIPQDLEVKWGRDMHTQGNCQGQGVPLPSVLKGPLCPRPGTCVKDMWPIGSTETCPLYTFDGRKD